MHVIDRESTSWGIHRHRPLASWAAPGSFLSNRRASISQAQLNLARSKWDKGLLANAQCLVPKFQTTSVVHVGFLQFPRLHLRIISPWQALPFRANGHLSIQRMDFLYDFSTVSSYVLRILQYVIFHTQLLGQRSKLWQLLDKASVSPKTSTFAQCLSTGWQCFGKLTCTWARRQSIELWQERRHLLAPSKSSGLKHAWIKKSSENNSKVTVEKCH